MIATDHLPKGPGCYLFKNGSDRIIYIGKAKDVLKRVRSYFQKRSLDPKTQLLIRDVSHVDFIATDTETEAFVLENTLIKKHQPRYNINLKDSKSYAYIQRTEDRFPRLVIARKKTGKGKFFGPFVSGQERDYVLEVVRKIFQVRTCRNMPKKACLRYHIGLCSAPCVGHIAQKEYDENMRHAERVLRGHDTEVVTELQHEMERSAKEQQFERSLKLRDQIFALQRLNERQNMVREKRYDEDIINYIIRDDHVYLMLFNVYKGTLANKHEFHFDHNPDFFEEFLIQYYAEHPVPKELIVPVVLTETLAVYLRDLRGSNVRVVVPKKGEKRQLLLLVEKNVEITFFGDESKLIALQKALRLQQQPAVIECFDISHLSGTSTVGSMVQFRNARQDKSNYRRFQIRTVEGVDDFKAIAEIVGRRYRGLLAEGASMPDLIVIDGGKGQLHAALGALEQLHLRIPTIALAKRMEEIYVPGRDKPLQLDRKEKALQYLQEIRDEAHRFAINYNRLKRKRGMFE
jgi:excinuclease ABC subunit C